MPTAITEQITAGSQVQPIHFLSTVIYICAIYHVWRGSANIWLGVMYTHLKTCQIRHLTSHFMARHADIVQREEVLDPISAVTG